MLFLMFFCDSCVLPNGTKSNVGNLNISILFLKSVLFPSQKNTKEGIQVMNMSVLKLCICYLLFLSEVCCDVYLKQEKLNLNVRIGI